MVDHIKKIEPDHFRVQQREEAQDEEHGKRQPQEDPEGKEEKDHFGAKANYKQVLTDESGGRRQQGSLWSRMPAPPVQKEDTAEPASPAHITEEFTVSTTTVTFLRAVGLIDNRGKPRWPFLTLYGLALVGFVATAIFLLRILL